MGIVKKPLATIGCKDILGGKETKVFFFSLLCCQNPLFFPDGKMEKLQSTTPTFLLSREKEISAFYLN